MKRIKKAALCVLCSLSLLVLLCAFVFDDGTVPEPVLINTQEFAADALLGVEAHYASDSVTLFESGSDKIVLKEYCSYNNASYHAAASTTDGILKIMGGKRPQNTSYRSYIELYVPAGFTGTISVRTASGKIASTGTAFAAPVSLSSASGMIDLRNPGFALDCNTASGQIQVEGSGLAGRLRTASGRVLVQTDLLGGDLDMNTASGSIEVTLDPSASFKLNASTASGNITNEFGGSSGVREWDARHGSNPVYTIDVNTASGSIHILKKAPATGHNQ